MTTPIVCQRDFCRNPIPNRRRKLKSKYCSGMCSAWAGAERRNKRAGKRCQDCGDKITCLATRCRYCAAEARRQYGVTG